MEPNIPVRAYAMAQNGRASGSFADNAAVPNPWALQQNQENAISSLNNNGFPIVLGDIHSVWIILTGLLVFSCMTVIVKLQMTILAAFSYVDIGHTWSDMFCLQNPHT